jgi:enamine deaminase RidA (YjgF/YER057c/UK114 family)
MERRRTYSGAAWEDAVGYCRAIRTGNRIEVSGSAPVASDGSVDTPGDGYRQAQRCIEIIGDALEALGSSLVDVVRTRMFVTDIDRWREYGRAHREAFGEHPPATSMVEVRRLIHPDMLIEIEAEAVV